MSRTYSAETKKILSDFIKTVQGRGDIDSRFLAELEQMTVEERLHSKSHVKQAIQVLKGRTDER
jgi:hypothetical protein